MQPTNPANPANRQAAPPKPQKGPEIEYVLMSAGWVPILPGSLSFAKAGEIAPWFPHEDGEIAWFVFIENGGRQVMGPATTIQGFKYSKGA